MNTELNQSKNYQNNNLFYFIIFILSLIALLFGLFYRNQSVNIGQSCNNGTLNFPECNQCPNAEVLLDNKCIKNISDSQNTMSDYEKFQSYNHVSIYPNGFVTPSDYITNDTAAITSAGRKIVITGELDDAYIYIKAGANDSNGNFSSILRDFDGIWFYLQNGQFLGGQLELDKSIFGKPSNLTELLYNLKSVSTAKNKDDYRNKIYRTQNLFSELNAKKEGELSSKKIIGALVSTQRYGKVEQLIIGYKCKEGSNCNIE